MILIMMLFLNLQFHKLFPWECQLFFKPMYHISPLSKSSPPLSFSIWTWLQQKWKSETTLSSLISTRQQKANNTQISTLSGTAHIFLKTKSNKNMVKRERRDLNHINQCVNSRWNVTIQIMFINKSKRLKSIVCGLSNSETLSSDSQLMSDDSFSSSTP